MKHTKLVLAIAATLTATASFSALAMDLYVDSKTKQVFTEPGKGRVLLNDSGNSKSGHTPFVPTPVAAPAADIEAIKKDLELKTNEIKALTEKADESAKPDAVKVSLTNGVKFE
ncbi:MAG: porin, partial [Methylococcales bacterium]